MVGQLKEDVAEWYQGLSAHMRIEAMCTLIDLSMPFEIRFLGSLIEHLGRKDFGTLRDAEARANSFVNANPEDKKKLLKALAEVSTGALVNGTQYSNPLMHPNNFNDSPANRPSPTHASETKGRLPTSETHGSDLTDHGLSNEPSNSHDLGPKGNHKAASYACNHIGCSSEEETESTCIANDHKRRKLILFVSVLAPTNHDGANLYYTILSDIEDSPALAWLDDLDKDAHEEVSLLYTLASRHPAFTFEQRTFLATVANRVNDIINSKFSRGNTTPQTAQSQTNSGTHPVYFNHAAFPQAVDPTKYGGYYIFAPPSMHIQQSPHQPSASNNGEQIRNNTVAAPFPAFAPYGPFYVSHPHHPLNHPTALSPQYTQNIIGSSIPIPSSAVVAGQNIQPAPVVSTVSQGNILPSHPMSKNQASQPHVSATNSLSQQSCMSTPSRTSSVPFQSEANSVDGDSEESSENCDWNSPESSPFESPPQSLTPSRSQSPPSGVPNSTSVQAVSLSGHSSTFLVTSSGSSVPYSGPGGSSSTSSTATVVKTEIHTSSGLVITTATSSSTSCSTSTTNSGNGSNNSSSNNNLNSNKTSNIMHHQTHHPPAPSVRVQPKNTSVANNQSFSNHLGSVVSSSVITVSQQPQTLPQMMGPAPVHMQQQTSTTVNNVGGVVSHSMSSPLVAFAQTHGAHNSLGHSSHPPSQNNYPCFPMQVSFQGMNAATAYRAPAQGVLTRNPYLQTHTNSLLGVGTQMVMKGSDQRGHNVHGSLRQKAPMQNTNTPKRRSNVTSVGSLNMSGPHNSQSTSGKGDEVLETKDRTNEIVVSANPPKNSQQERTSNKSYHHGPNGLINVLANTGGNGGSGVLPGNSLPNISANNSVVINNQQTVGINSTTNPGGQIMQTASKGEDGLLGDGSVLDNYPVSQLPYHINGPQMYGHPGAYIQLPNGYVTSSYYPSPMGAAAIGAGGPPVPPSTEIMMNPAGVPPFSFPFTIPQSYASPPPTGKGINSKENTKATNLHGSGGTNPTSGGTDSNKTIPSQHDNHVGPYPRAGVANLQPLPIGCYAAVAPTPSQPNRNNRGVILDIGGALGNSSLSPVNVDLAVMPPLEELVETVHRPRKISCYNCGASTHLGPDCKEGSMEEMTRHQFRVNYSGPSVTADGKDGD
ncbi:unnamed protein product [Orchesella dallaii]|uniref:CCHC-type domain-containing protein n=1 Tax=Orchesella dallaii TaxID=48710 RepID=A0ABP1QGM1_9HEXA